MLHSLWVKFDLCYIAFSTTKGKYYYYFVDSGISGKKLAREQSPEDRLVWAPSTSLWTYLRGMGRVKAGDHYSTLD